VFCAVEVIAANSPQAAPAGGVSNSVRNRNLGDTSAACSAQPMPAMGVVVQTLVWVR
jgi:hypothetical protein